MKYFYINNIKFNYTLEFQNNNLDEATWKQDAALIEYCKTVVGINIPHYCYHKSLSISGNCRMCLIELANSPKPIVSCSMNAKSSLMNNKIFTNSPLVKKARENVLEFLLLNHPLDCPICDQGGECDLQDQSFFFGLSKKRFYNFKRIVTDKNIGPIVKTVMTRCIHCTRCVRFASEIAGIDDLGMFGRGLTSEIGTYVNKTFQSELSGNIIDLCPVGALTSKPYPFTYRSWELKNVNSIDFSNGFGVDLQVYLKNNKVIKVLPDYANQEINWITDKTRFSFDGMFSPERILNGYSISGNNSLEASKTWASLFEEIVKTLYFQDHLIKHLLNVKKLTIIFTPNISLEVLNLLILLTKKYSFIKLRKLEGNLINNDIESNFLLKSTLKNNYLSASKLCLLIGVNTRYEGATLNLKLKQRYSKGNFKMLNINAITDLTIPTSYLSLNLKTLNSIAEGNNLFCQELLNNSNPIIILSSEIFNRKDSKDISTLIENIKNTLTTYYTNWNNLNVLNLSINQAGISYLQNIKAVSDNDLLNNGGFYCINASMNDLNFKKVINLKLLNYFTNSTKTPTFYIEQNNGFPRTISKQFLNKCEIYQYVNLPNNLFFESTGTYLNTEGIFKKNIKFIPALKQTREDWQIIRKLFANTKKISFISNFKYNTMLSYNNKTFLKYKNFIGFLYYTNQVLTNKNYYMNKETSIALNLNINNKFKTKKSKVFTTKFKLWLHDFYIGGKDLYSKYSLTMINCSKSYRLEKTNFSYNINSF
jgi:NADH-quinone oxidoreductase chain G